MIVTVIIPMALGRRVRRELLSNDYKPQYGAFSLASKAVCLDSIFIVRSAPFARMPP